MVGQRAHRACARFNYLIHPAATQSPESGHLRSESEVKRWAKNDILHRRKTVSLQVPTYALQQVV
jgi:hypothetical protein